MKLSERMKLYEYLETSRVVLPRLPVCVRVDGRAFHTLTQKLRKPFDVPFHRAMVETGRFLASETNSLIAYIQSDEITLVLYEDKPDSQILFNGKIFKLTSAIASMATAKFNQLAVEVPGLAGVPIFRYTLPEEWGDEKTNAWIASVSSKPPAPGQITVHNEATKVDWCVTPRLAFFDCRVWNVPNLEEAANVILWRELDATRNSIQSAARSVYSHKQCLGKNSDELREMLFQKGINWNDYPDSFKRGTFVFPRVVEKPMTEKHKRWHNYTKLTYKRTEWQAVTLPPLLKIENRVDVLFLGAEPKEFFEDLETT